jgi:hypothetical protein
VPAEEISRRFSNSLQTHHGSDAQNTNQQRKAAGAGNPPLVQP